jgi:nucleoside-diphosphate-sugar epimerase
MSKILVVGGAGYIGGFLTDHLRESGHNVVVYDNLLLHRRFPNRSSKRIRS